MISKFGCFAVMAWMLYGLANAEDADDPFAVGATSSDPPTPDHLIPLRPYPSDKEIAYTKQLRKHLSLDQVYLARMIVLSRAEYSMRVYGDVKSYDFAASKEFFVTCTISNASIWDRYLYSMSAHNFEEIPKAIKPTSFNAPIPAETARRICGIWDEMIFRTRYAREVSGGVDGLTIEFASRYGHGESWNPNDGTSPALLRAIGEALIAYCKAPTDEREKLLESVDASAAKLETHLKLQAEQDGTEQPATSPESKSEGEDKPQPESEGRSR